MINNIKNNRKYILFIILNILIIYTAYIYLIANDKNKILEDLNYEVVMLNSDNIELQSKEKSLLNNEDSFNNDDKFNSSFIKDKFHVNIENLFDEIGLKINEYRLINTERVELDNFIYYRKEIYYNLISKLSNLDKLVDRLNTEKILIKDLKLERISIDDFSVYLIIEEFSLESISHSGIRLKEIQGDNLSNIESINLLEENFGLKEEEDEEEKNNTNNIKETINTSKKRRITSKEQGIVKETTPLLENKILETKKTNKTIDDYIQLAKNLDKKEEISEEGSYKQLINKTYFEDNYFMFSNNLELLNYFSYDSELDEWKIKIENELNLDKAPIVLTEYIGNYYLKAFADKDSLIKVYMKSANTSEIELEINCMAEKLNLYQFSLPDSKELMPITIYKIVVSSPEDNVNANISNFVYIEK